MNKIFGSFVSFLFLLLIFIILIPIVVIQFAITNTTIKNLRTEIDHRLNAYAEIFASSFINECHKCEANLLFARDFICNNKLKKEAIASFFFNNEPYFYRISLLDHNGSNIFSFVVNPDQTYLSPHSYEEFKNLPPVNLKNVKSQGNVLFIPMELQAIPGGIAQPTLVPLKHQKFLLAEINISHIFARALKSSIFLSGTFLLTLGGDGELLFSSSEDIQHKDIMNLLNYSVTLDYRIKDHIYRTRSFIIDTLEYFGKNYKNLKLIIGIDYGNMIDGIKKGLGGGLKLTTIYAGLICFVFILFGLYTKNKTDVILKRTDEIAKGEFDKKISIRFPNEFREIAKNINELSSKLKTLTGEKVKSAKLSAIGRFAAHMVHDLRNPVYGLSLLAYELKKAIKKDDPKVRYFEEIVAGIKRLGDIVDKIAEHGRIYEPKIEDIDLNGLISDTANEFSKEYPCRITTQFGDIGIVKIDPAQWRRVFLNLFQNSYEAKKEDCQITIKTYLSPGQPQHRSPSLFIEISDYSGGIPPEIIDNIFEPFTTTKKKGLGLGLSYIKEIVEINNGSITIENNPGIGVKFIITLPVI